MGSKGKGEPLVWTHACVCEHVCLSLVYRMDRRYNLKENVENQVPTNHKEKLRIQSGKN